MSERCESCKVSLDFPSSREVLDKKRTCPACGHTQAVHKSILYVVETLEEQIEWLSERLSGVEAKVGIDVARPKPLPAPRLPVIHPPVDILDIPASSGKPMPAGPDIDLFGLGTPVEPGISLKDLI